MPVTDLTFVIWNNRELFLIFQQDPEGVFTEIYHRNPGDDSRIAIFLRPKVDFHATYYSNSTVKQFPNGDREYKSIKNGYSVVGDGRTTFCDTPESNRRENYKLILEHIYKNYKRVPTCIMVH